MWFCTVSGELSDSRSYSAGCGKGRPVPFPILDVTMLVVYRYTCSRSVVEHKHLGLKLYQTLWSLIIHCLLARIPLYL